MLGTQDVVAQQPLQRGGVPDGAALELLDEDGGAVAGGGGGAPEMRDAGRHLTGPAGPDGEDPAVLTVEATAGVRGGDRGQRVGVGTQSGEQDLGDRPSGGEPHQVEAERGGTDQRVGHGSASSERSPEVESPMLTVIGRIRTSTDSGRHPFAGERGSDGRVACPAVLSADHVQ